MTFRRKLVGRDPVPEFAVDTNRGAARAGNVGLMGCRANAIQENLSIGADQLVNSGIDAAVQLLLKNRPLPIGS